MSLLMSLMMLSMVVVMISMSMASIRRIGEVLDETPDLHDPEHPVMEVEDGSIDFNHVSFSYKHGSGKNALTDIDLHIKSGETIGVIGGTGTGKSSLVNLICRLYDVDEGSVKVGGLDVRSTTWRPCATRCPWCSRRTPCSPAPSWTTCAGAIRTPPTRSAWRPARPPAPTSSSTASRTATTPGSSGAAPTCPAVRSSGLCIARALLKKPKVLILDDSTSAVDTATDAKIREAFAESIPGTTKIIIAQRVSSVEDADRILVLDNGRIDGFDTHENLLKSNAIYQEIYESQIKGGGDFDQPA